MTDYGALRAEDGLLSGTALLGIVEALKTIRVDTDAPRHHIGYSHHPLFSPVFMCPTWGGNEGRCQVFGTDPRQWLRSRKALCLKDAGASTNFKYDHHDSNFDIDLLRPT